MPLRFATAHRFLAAREILALPAAVKRPCLAVSAFPGCFFAALGETWELTVVLARTTAAFAESSNAPKPSVLFGNWSMTSDSNSSILFNLFRAFFAFIGSLLQALYITTAGWHLTSADALSAFLNSFGAYYSPNEDAELRAS
jgi:hypothetical protein